MPIQKTSNRKKTGTISLESSNLGKLPPQAIELEEAVLGALLIEKDAFTNVSNLLSVDTFYKEQHKYIYQAIMELATKELPIDVLSVAEKLKQHGNLEKVGGVLYLSALTQKVISSAHLNYHAQIIHQKAMAREIIKVSSNLIELAYDETQDVQDIIDHAESEVFQISQRSQKREVTQIDPVIKEALDRMKIAATTTGNISGVPSGFTELDKITSGWQKSDLIIIAARPAMGKTAFVLSMAKNIAVNYKKPVALFTLEMSNVQLVNRLIMNVCELEGEKIKTGKLSKEEWNQFDQKIPELMGAKIFIDDTPSLSVYELKSKARKLVQEHKVELIIIDYLQLMNAQGMSFGSREQEVSIISRNLKVLAKDLDIPIIALSQLNRGVESRSGIEGKTPQLSDLRESGAIEQDADMVCFIHRPEYYRIYNDEKTNKDLRGLGQIIVAKHRNGRTDSVWLRFRGMYAKFEDDVENDDDVTTTVGNYVQRQSSMNQMASNDSDPFANGARLDDEYGGI
jgi:replicative DNA helicase